MLIGYFAAPDYRDTKHKLGNPRLELRQEQGHGFFYVHRWFPAQAIVKFLIAETDFFPFRGTATPVKYWR